jgi:hypothetical protein
MHLLLEILSYGPKAGVYSAENIKTIISYYEKLYDSGFFASVKNAIASSKHKQTDWSRYF